MFQPGLRHSLAATLAFLPARNTWPLPPSGSRLVGQNQFHVVQDNGGSLEAIAKKYNVGFLALLQANPGVDPYVPRAGSVLTIPLQTLLPDAPVKVWCSISPSCACTTIHLDRIA